MVAIGCSSVCAARMFPVTSKRPKYQRNIRREASKPTGRLRKEHSHSLTRRECSHTVQGTMYSDPDVMKYKSHDVDGAYGQNSIEET